MKYLILGSNGMAGHLIAHYLKERGHEVLGFAREESQRISTIIGDARDERVVADLISGQAYDYVINCIGILNRSVDCNLKDGIYLNSVFPHYVADLMRNKDGKLIHISTDCVFDGKRGAYIEKDLPDEISYYGRSKALGEVVDDKNLTLRTSIIGPEMKQDGIGLLHWFLSQRESVNGYSETIWSGVTTLQLARAIEMDAEIDCKGLYHLVNNTSISKYELLLLFNKYLKKDSVLIKKDENFKSDKSIISTRTEIDYHIPSYEAMVKELADWILSHRDLYKMYFDEDWIKL